jgi:hypothetical protein
MNDTTNTELSEAIAANYIAMQVALSSWSGKATDKAAAAKLTASEGAIAEAAKVTKNLMAGADKELKAVLSAQNHVRTYFYSVTVPWAADAAGAKRGPRLLAVTRSLEVLKEIKILHTKFDEKLAAFVAVYDQRRTEALTNLSGMADSSLYPTASSIQDEFGIRVHTDTLGAKSDFSRLQGVPPELAEWMGNRKVIAMQDQINNAMADLQTRTLEAVQRMATQLGKVGRGEKTPLYGTMLGNLSTLVQLLRDTNVSGAEAVDTLADRIAKELLAFEIDAYKGNETLSREISEKAAAIAAEMPEFEWLS